MGRALAGQRVGLHLWAKARAWIVIQGTQVLNPLPLKGLYGAALPCERFVEFMMGHAVLEQRLRTAQERRARQSSSSSPERYDVRKQERLRCEYLIQISASGEPDPSRSFP